MTIERYAKPFIDRGVEPDAPHMGTVDYALASQTETLAFRNCGSSRSWTYPIPGPNYLATGPFNSSVAPTAEITAIDTWTPFRISEAFGASIPVHFPWKYGESAKETYVEAVLATESSAHLKFRFYMVRMVDAVSPTYSTHSTSGPASEVPSMDEWISASQSGPELMRVTRRRGARVRDPELPATGSRQIAIVPQVMVTNGHEPFAISAKVYVYLVELMAVDRWGEWAVGG